MLAGAGLAHHALVPELRRDLAARGVHLLDDAAPARESRRRMEVRYVGVVRGGRPVDRGALGARALDLLVNVARGLEATKLSIATTKDFKVLVFDHDDEEKQALARRVA